MLLVKKKNKYLSILFVTLLLLTGCWDKKEIDDQQFVISLGIDKSEKETISSKNSYRYNITYATPNLSTVQKNGGGNEPFRYFQYVTGDTLTGTIKKAQAYYLEPINFEHVKTIILGKELAKDKVLFQEVLDYIDRTPQFGRTVLVMIAENTAKEILEAKEETKPFRNRYAIHSQDITSIPDELIINVGKVLNQLINNEGTTFIPRIKKGKNNLGFSGGAVFRDYQFQGWLDEAQVRVLSWTLGKNKGGYFPIWYQGAYVPYEVSHISSKVVSATYDKYLKVKVQIETEGDISEYILDNSKKYIDSKWVKQLEIELEEAIKKEIRDVFDILQMEYKVDIIGLKDQLKLKYPKVWKEIKEDYEKIFEEAEIEIDVNISIRRIGMVY